MDALVAPAVTAAVLSGDLDGPARYLQWGPIQISVANLVVILLMVVVFVLAILLPFPKGRRRP